MTVGSPLDRIKWMELEIEVKTKRIEALKAVLWEVLAECDEVMQKIAEDALAEEQDK